MFSPSERTLTVTGIAVAVLLLWLAFYTGAFASPYVADDSYQYNHEIVPETAAGYNETVDTAPTYRYSELSPIAQTFVDRTRAAPDNEYRPVVCQEFVLTCDEYTPSMLPEEFTYGEEIDVSEASVVIQDGDQRFLLQTGMVGHGWFGIPVRFLIGMLTLLPLAAVVVGITMTDETIKNRGSAIVVGLGVAVIGLVSPYVEMAGVFDAHSAGFVVMGGVWIGIIGLGVRWIAQRRTHSKG